MKSPAAIGGGNFGGAGSPSTLIGTGLDEHGARSALDAAEGLGISIVDTAYSYAGGASQKMIGGWLAADGERRARTTLVDKVGVVEVGGELQLQLQFDALISQAEEGRTRMGVDEVDVIMAHAPDPNTPVEETLRGFGALMDARLAAGWGVSNVDSVTLSDWVQTARQLGLPDPRFVENQYNLVQREAENAVLPFCREQQIEFLAYSPTAGGLLSGKYRRDEPPPDGSMMALRPDMAADFDIRVEEVITAVREIATAHEVSNVAVAFAWLLEQPGVIPIAGPSKPHHMEAIGQALELTMSDHDLQRLSSS